MEKISNETETPEINSTQDEEKWKAHILAAQSFAGTYAEYCRRNELHRSRFYFFKKKFGADKVRTKSTKQFVKVERLAPLAEQEPKQTKRSPPRIFPDPAWVAEFVKALLG